ncbi:GspE/PulE family protein [Candidatus Margulisiibacteriota bacterium]
MGQNIIKLFDEIIGLGIQNLASDIHIEPKKNDIQIRYRIDGVLQAEKRLNKNLHNQLVSRIKVLVDLDITETRLPQDGRTDYKNFDLRISTIPTIFGEKVVLRILRRAQTLMPLNQLGMGEEELKNYRRLINQKNGIVLVSGPTGSGKTTTLYATLKEFDPKDKNIVTIEDPVEYILEDINQIQVNNKAGLTFAHGLRSILRQDPDIILIGEIRDLETAQIAINAALTGHLVLATIHTNDAIASVCRLIDMGIPNYLVSATLLGTVAQRLLRKKEGGRIGVYEVFSLGDEIREKINKIYSKTNIMEAAQFKTLSENARNLEEQGTIDKKEIYRILGSE